MDQSYHWYGPSIHTWTSHTTRPNMQLIYNKESKKTKRPHWRPNAVPCRGANQGCFLGRVKHGLAYKQLKFIIIFSKYVEFFLYECKTALYKIKVFVIFVMTAKFKLFSDGAHIKWHIYSLMWAHFIYPQGSCILCNLLLKA